MAGYWPFWILGPALGVLPVGYWIAMRRPLGVAGVAARFSRIREEAEFDRGTAVLQAEQAALEAAMTALTAEAFGPLPQDPAGEAPRVEAGAGAPAVAGDTAPAVRTCAPPPPLSVHATFLLAIVAGGFIASLLRGTFGHGLGDAFATHVAQGPAGITVLAAGGILVGFGTSLCGGCSTGHGLTGCGRLMAGSLVATATFFASAIVTSLLLAWRFA